LPICLANSVFPTPDEPRKRNTNGDSSLVQPDSFRRIAKETRGVFCDYFFEINKPAQTVDMA